MEGNSCRGGVSIVCDEEGAMLPLVLDFICAVLLPWCSETVPSRQGHQPAVCIEGWQTALASPLPALRALASCQGPYMWWNETPTYSPPKRKKERVHVKNWWNLRHGTNISFLVLMLYYGYETWRRTWPPTPVFLPGESQGQRSLVGYSPCGHKESDTTEVT